MTTTYEIYANEDGTPVAVTGGSSGASPAIVERVENLETSVENLETSVETAQATAEACLPLAGGTMVGAIKFDGSGALKGLTDASSIQIYGGTAWEAGAMIGVYGKSHATRAGWFYLSVHDGTNTKTLVGKPDGTLQWGGYNFITSAGGTIEGKTFIQNELALRPKTGEGGELHLDASEERKSTSGIVVDTNNGQFRVFGIPSADGTTRTGVGNTLTYDPYTKDFKIGSGTVVFITASWRSGENWYRKWSDGFIEQGGILAYNGSSGTITYHTPYTQANPVADYNTANSGHGEYTLSAVTKTNFTWQSNVSRSGYLFWRASGY